MNAKLQLLPTNSFLLGVKQDFTLVSCLFVLPFCDGSKTTQVNHLLGCNLLVSAHALTLVSKCDNQIPAHDQMCTCIKFWVDAFQSVKHYLSLAPFLGEWRLIWLLKLRWWWMPVGWSFGASSLVTHVIDSAQLFYLGCLKLSKEKFLMLMKTSAFAHFMEIVPKGLAGQ